MAGAHGRVGNEDIRVAWRPAIEKHFATRDPLPVAHFLATYFFGEHRVVTQTLKTRFIQAQRHAGLAADRICIEVEPALLGYDTTMGATEIAAVDRRRNMVAEWVWD